MREKSPIEWTNATWDPRTGDTQVSPVGDRCYAKTFAQRFRGTPGHPYEQGFDLRVRPERLGSPMKWKTPKMIFVKSMSDLFQPESGRGARPMQEDWVRAIRDPCIACQIAFFDKQQVISGRKISLPELGGQERNQVPHLPGARQEVTI